MEQQESNDAPSTDQKTVRRKPIFTWMAIISESLISAACIVYLFTQDGVAFMVWESLAALYLVIGLALIWRGRPSEESDHTMAVESSKWFWLPPLLVSIVGVDSAVVALKATNVKADDWGILGVLIISCLGIVLSWAMLQVGFGRIYRTMDIVNESQGIDFPGSRQASTLDYMYFSFTLGTSFATSDASIIDVRIRRIVLLHSIISFFFNGLVVAVIFQVLQGLVK